MAVDGLHVLDTFKEYCRFHFGQPTQHDGAIVEQHAFGYLADAADSACIFGPLYYRWNSFILFSMGSSDAVP